MPDAWFSYDGIAREYSAAAEQIYFAAPAFDLMALVTARAGGTLLDVGVGSGVVAMAALRSGYRGRVIGCDVSIGMLNIARERMPDLFLVAAALSQLPFSGRRFAAVTASFVLSHLPDVAASLAEIRRLLNSRGCLGATSWAVSAGESAAGRLWSSIASQFVSVESLQMGTLSNLPSEDKLSTLDDFARVVQQAGFTDVCGEQKVYAVQVDTSDFLRSRLISLASRYMAAHLSADARNEFLATARQAFSATFGERVNLETTVNFITARPAA